jgi:hypothetical protein
MDYERVFRGHSRGWGCGVASLRKKRGGTTFGYVALVTEEQLALMDRYEGVNMRSPKYRRVMVTAYTGADDPQPLQAVAYVSTSREVTRPSQEYLEACARTVGSFWGDVKPSDFPLRNPGGFDERMRRMERELPFDPELAAQFRLMQVRGAGEVPSTHRISMASYGIWSPAGSVLCTSCLGDPETRRWAAARDTATHYPATCDRCGRPVRISRDDVALENRVRHLLRTVYGINMSHWQTGGMCSTLGATFAGGRELYVVCEGGLERAPPHLAGEDLRPYWFVTVVPEDEQENDEFREVLHYRPVPGVTTGPGGGIHLRTGVHETARVVAELYRSVQAWVEAWGWQ